MPARIEDYALIGDTQTAALVGRDGSIDWLCVPRFDSRACFAALVGHEDNGRWLLAPEGEVMARGRQYRRDTLILDTHYETESGGAVVTDFMPIRDDAIHLIRIVEGRAGRVRMRMELTPRFDYGSIAPWIHRIDDGIVAIAGPDGLRLSTDVGVEVEEHEGSIRASFEIGDGERNRFVLSWFPSHAGPPRAPNPELALVRAQRYWRSWSDRCSYDGRYREAVVRALITLKALTYAPTGGIVAAPTTSLPEAIGGVRNWDYRYCWLRDATFTLLSLMEAGYEGEAKAFRDWLLRTVAGDPSKLQIVYGVGGERRLSEIELDWLDGYEGSTPVRIGNDAYRQFQLDVYGEVLDLLHQSADVGRLRTAEEWDMELALVDFLESSWEQPDEGIWEVRGKPRHFTHSKVMAWVGIDRAVRDVERRDLPGPVDEWKKLRKRIHAEVCEKGFDPDLGSFVQSYGSTDLDASLLRVPLVGFLPPDDERVEGTIRAIEDNLVHDGFVARYEAGEDMDGLPGSEGVFLPCTFWLADAHEMAGRHDRAVEIFESLLEIRNDVGLLAEEYEPKEQRALGNFPQALSMLSLVTTALNLEREGGGPTPRRSHGGGAHRDKPPAPPPTR
ncbi:MAG: glycoside hydrolase family 15 protein [Actinomycetota bacterium]